MAHFQQDAANTGKSWDIDNEMEEPSNDLSSVVVRSCVFLSIEDVHTWDDYHLPYCLACVTAVGGHGDLKIDQLDFTFWSSKAQKYNGTWRE